MDLRSGFVLGEWIVNPLDGRLQCGDEIKRIQPKAMDVLVALAESRETVVEREYLLQQVWGERAVTDEPLTRCIGDLRRALGDQRDAPTYIETIPKRGYRLLMPARQLESAPGDLEPIPVRPAIAQSRRRYRWLVAGAGLLALAVTVALVLKQWSDAIDGRSGSMNGALGDESPAVAVLPFLNLSADLGDAYMADGTAETLTHVLSRIDGLKVVARSSAFVFREAEDVRVIGEALQVDVVLEGSVQVSGDIMRVTTQLVATEDGRHLWSAAYDRPVTDLFAIQDEIAADVARALQVNVLGAQSWGKDSPRDFEAYREYLLGIERLQERTVDSILAAQDHFSRARELDPDYALAHVGYADAISLQNYYLNRPIDEVKALALPALATALDLDESLGEAYAALGVIRFNDGDIEGAESAMQRAVTLSPNYPRAWFGYGTIYNDTGRPNEALAMHLRALELNPLAPHINNAVAVAYEKLGRFEEAVARFERTIEIAPGYGAVLYRLGALKWRVEGDAIGAIELFERAFAADPANPWSLAMLARVYLDLDDESRARQVIGRAKEADRSAAIGEIEAMLLTRANADPGERLAAVEAYSGQTSGFGFDSRFLRIARDAHLERNDTAAALALFERTNPELFRQSPTIDWLNFAAAVDLARILINRENAEAAGDLLNRVERYIARIPRLGCCGYGIVDVEIAALRGDTDSAIAALSQAIDEGWKADWWLETLYNPNLSVLVNDPRYLPTLGRLRNSMEEQRTSLLPLLSKEL
ncbi:MAG: tetratricopeptide repeat protein [Pseudomonadota bacterium]